jgi:hypothetical protein
VAVIGEVVSSRRRGPRSISRCTKTDADSISSVRHTVVLYTLVEYCYNIWKYYYIGLFIYRMRLLVKLVLVRVSESIGFHNSKGTNSEQQHDGITDYGKQFT